MGECDPTYSLILDEKQSTSAKKIWFSFFYWYTNVFENGLKKINLFAVHIFKKASTSAKLWKWRTSTYIRLVGTSQNQLPWFVLKHTFSNDHVLNNVRQCENGAKTWDSLMGTSSWAHSKLLSFYLHETTCFYGYLQTHVK